MRFLSFCILFSVSVMGAKTANTQGPIQPTLSPAASFIEESGEALYANICQACHMEDAKGAVGAGYYPPLAENPKLEDSGYAIHIVLHGLKAMPPMEKMLSDAQTAALVNYLRTHFGNSYTDSVTAKDVAEAR
jgi:mono/diheme cytochrome c family protein